MKIIIFLYRFFLSRRYNVEIQNSELLKHDGPILLLPNHVALIDPQILMSFFNPYLSLSPVASEKFFNVPILKQVMQSVWTIPIWEMTAWADKDEVKKVFKKVVSALEKNKNILIYPSGEIYKQGFESIIGKQAVYNIAQNMPKNTRVIWLKDTGLWGSMWSKAWNNWQTWFFTLFWKSIFMICVNFLFFTPKRTVTLNLTDISAQIQTYKNMSLWEFNGYLENFYNKDWEEKAHFIPHYWFYNDTKNKKEPDIITWSLKDLQKTKNHDLSKIDPKIIKSIIQKIVTIKELKDNNQISTHSKLIIDLFFDSLDLAEIKSFVQANFDWASNPPIWDLKTVWDLIIMAVGQSQNVEEIKKCEWKSFNSKGLLVDKII